MTRSQQPVPVARIIVFQENGSGEKKIQGVRDHGRDIDITKVYDITGPLPDFIDTPEKYITDDFSCDLVLCFLKHPDLADYLVFLCNKKKIPVIASGKKIEKAHTPFTCCGLGLHKELGAYGNQFGLPELEVTVTDNRIETVTVRRGAPCGATWEVVPRIIGMQVDEALSTFAREVQYVCVSDPSAFDPISGKSGLHYAGNVHIAALKKAVNKTL